MNPFQSLKFLPYPPRSVSSNSPQAKQGINYEFQLVYLNLDLVYISDISHTEDEIGEEAWIFTSSYKTSLI